MMKRFRVFVLFVLVWSVFGFPVIGEEPDAIREAAHRAAEYLLEQVGEEEEIWILPPYRARRRIGTREVVVRYREDVVEVPVYEMIEKEVLVEGHGGSSIGTAGLERRTRQVRGEQIGTREELRRRRDPEGSIVERENRPQWGPGGPDEWLVGQLGHNALAGVALLRSEHPEAREAVAPMLEFFREVMAENGPPDLTWDLAWMLMLFAESEEVDLQNEVPEMVGKLMSAQISSGEGEGLWGPMAVSPEILSGYWRLFWRANAEHETLLERFGERPSNAADQRRLVEARREIEKAREGLTEYTWSFRNTEPHRAWVDVEDAFGDEVLFRMRRPPEYPINQQTADVESTWLALYAIRVARDYGLVPSELPVSPAPPGARRRAMAPQAPSPREVLEKAAAALSRHAQGNGTFSELNLHGGVDVFDDLEGLLGVPLEVDDFPELSSPVTLTATAQGFAALMQYGRVMGMGALRPHAGAMVRAKAVLDQQMDRALEGESDIVGGSGLGLLNFYLALLDPGPEIASAPRALRRDAAEHLVATQSRNGSWRLLEEQAVYKPTVWRARAEVLPEIPRAWSQFNYGQPFVNLGVEEDSERYAARNLQQYSRVQPALSTAVGLLVLAEEIRGTEVMPEEEEEEGE